VRDSAFTLWALHALGLDAEADDFLAFLRDVLEPEDRQVEPASTERNLQVLYGVDGSSTLTESEINHLSG
jgi:GH15 family glucan-1,4-alpha-glucosidase